MKQVEWSVILSLYLSSHILDIKDYFSELDALKKKWLKNIQPVYLIPEQATPTSHQMIDRKIR